MSDTAKAADLETEIRRLRLRIIGLSAAQLDSAGAHGAPRRAEIRRHLVEFSLLGSGGREVPVLGDRALADQVTLLLGECLRGVPPGDLAGVLDAAVSLRRALA